MRLISLWELRGAANLAEEGPKRSDEEFWFDVGRRTAVAFARRAKWLSRRVETIEFSGRCTVVRHISVDFEIPEDMPDLGDRAAAETALVPISVFQKWPPLMGFNFVDPDGHPTSLYLRTTNNALDFGLLLGMADLALDLAVPSLNGHPRGFRLRRSRPASEPEPERLPSELRRQLAAVIEEAQPHPALVADAANGLRSELECQLKGALERERSLGASEIATHITAAVDLTAQLAASSILWVPAKGTKGTDRIVKFSYLDAHDTRPDAEVNGAGSARRVRIRALGRRAGAAWKHVAIACSWRTRTIFISLPHAGRHARFHLDVRAPRGSIELVEVQAMAFPPASGAHGVSAQVRSVPNLARDYEVLDEPDEFVGPESSRYYMDYGEPVVLASTSAKPSPDDGTPDDGAPDTGASAEIVDRRSHVYLGARTAPSHRVFLQVKMGAMRRGFIWGCATAATMIAVLMTVAYVSLKSAALHLEATVVLLSAVPVVLGYVLVRPDQHALERRHIAGVRSMALVSGAMPILGALTLVLTRAGNGTDPPPDLTLAKPIWTGLLAVSWVMVLGLLFSLAFAAPAKDRNKRSATGRGRAHPARADPRGNGLAQSSTGSPNGDLRAARPLRDLADGRPIAIVGTSPLSAAEGRQLRDLLGRVVGEDA